MGFCGHCGKEITYPGTRSIRKNCMIIVRKNGRLNTSRILRKSVPALRDSLVISTTGIVLSQQHRKHYLVCPLHSILTSTRGHNFKLLKPLSKCHHCQTFFCIRSINDWNNLPDYIVNATSLNQFKYLLDNY